MYIIVVVRRSVVSLESRGYNNTEHTSVSNADILFEHHITKAVTILTQKPYTRYHHLLSLKVKAIIIINY